jgi:predicted Zn-dependent peptidase
LPNSNTISIGIFIKAGSRQEDKTFGIAHFLEHMTFKGTTNITSEQLMLKLDMIGAQYNAMTGHEFTLYYISGNPTDIELILQIVIDLYLNPIFPETDIEKERNVVLEELRMNKDNNSRQLSHKIFNEIFKNAKDNLISLSRPVIGFKDTIEKLTRTDIIDYRNKHYKSSNCLLCISGNFNIDNTIKLVENNFNISYIIPELEYPVQNLVKSLSILNFT